jgi:hypothetical protein
VFKNPKYEKHFRSFVEAYESPEQRRAHLQSIDAMRHQHMELIRKEDDDFMTFGRTSSSNNSSNGDEDDEKYN